MDVEEKIVEEKNIELIFANFHILLPCKFSRLL